MRASAALLDVKNQIVPCASLSKCAVIGTAVCAAESSSSITKGPLLRCAQNFSFIFDSTVSDMATHLRIMESPVSRHGRTLAVGERHECHACERSRCH